MKYSSTADVAANMPTSTFNTAVILPVQMCLNRLAQLSGRLQVVPAAAVASGAIGACRMGH